MGVGDEGEGGGVSCSETKGCGLSICTHIMNKMCTCLSKRWFVCLIAQRSAIQ